MRIALLAVLAFAGLWLVALRPKPVADPATAPAPGNGVLSAPDKAKGAVAKADGAAAKAEATAKAAGDGTAAAPASKSTQAAKAAAKPATAAAAKPAAESDEKVSPQVRSVLDDLQAGKVVVLLFWDRKISDDQEVRRAVGQVSTRGGKVKVHLAPIGKLGDFEPITRGLPVVTSPTTLVIDKTKRARVISGLTITREIDQAVGLALRGR